VTIVDEWRGAIDAMNLRRGMVRLAIGASALWFVFWTFAYVLHPPSSLNPEPAFAIRISTWGVVVPCVVAALLLGAWIAAGFLSGGRRPLT
jgi:hypothetical protein